MNWRQTLRSTASHGAKCLAPLLFLLAAYGSLRLWIPELSEHIHYSFMPHVDHVLFGQLPTITLQHWLWQGHASWYDYFLYAFYASHYILVVVLAALIYIYRHREYVRFAATYILASSTAFLFFIIYPTAPPWLASQDGYIPHLVRVSGAIYGSLGVHNYSSAYSRYVPDPVAALPSLHSVFAFLFVLFVYRYFGRRWAALSLLYPLCIVFGVIYMGEHYAVDVIAGALLASVSYLAVPRLLGWSHRVQGKLIRPSVGLAPGPEN